MVNVTGKPVTDRVAVARGEIAMLPETLAAITDGRIPKGNVFEAARISAIMAAKATASIIPLCHPLQVTGVEVSFKLGEASVLVETSVSTADRTGVEMEALTSVTVALLCIYDMCKAIDKGMIISNVRLIHKAGGRSGTYSRKDYAPAEDRNSPGKAVG